MKSSDLSEFMRVLSSVSALYGKVLSKPLTEMYWAALSEFDLASVKQALSAHTVDPDKGQYMPKPADIVCFLQGTRQSQALSAWSGVVKAIQEVGGYNSVVFDDPVIHAVIQDMGGWVTLCQVRLNELPFRGHNFTARYVSYVGKPLRAYPPQLTGMLAHQNALGGFEAEPPVCIGNLEKAMQVYQQGQLPLHPYSRLPYEARKMCIAQAEEGIA